MSQAPLPKQGRSPGWRSKGAVLAAAATVLACAFLLDQRTLAQLHDRYSEQGVRREIHRVLRDHRMNVTQGLEVAEAVAAQSRRTDIPVLMFLGLMRTESNFNVHAVSSKRAMGIMQIHPVTWEAYVKKLNLSSSREEAFRPSVNIMVSAAILEDLRDKYLRMGYQEPKLWDHVLSAYYAGEGSVKGGLKRHHRSYVNKVRTYVNEYGQKISG